jgi:dTDP-4-dehydrorhamnose reductase
MRVLVIGSSGQLGAELIGAFDGADVTGLDHAAIEIESAASIEQALREHRPDVVVNTAAFHNVELCETQPDRAFAVNAFAVDELAAQISRAGARLVHLSTDYVFDGTSRVPYVESDRVGPLSIYAASKAAGEQFVARRDAQHVIVRTSGLYGIRGSRSKGGHSFIERMLTRAQAGEALEVVTDVVFSPSYASHVAQAIARIVALDAGGIYHVTNCGSCSWYEFAKEILRQAQLDADLRATTATQFASKVKRPAFSALAHAAMERAGLPAMPPWQDGIRDYLRERAKAV